MGLMHARQYWWERRKKRRKALVLGAACLTSSHYIVEGWVANRTRVRMVWAVRRDSLTELEFRQRYRLDKGGFAEVLQAIKPHLTPPRAQCPSQVEPELKLSMFLRWVAGGADLDIADMHGVARSTFYHHLWEVAEAIEEAYELPLLDAVDKMDSRLEQFEEGFANMSHGVLRGCIGAIDGLAVKIEKPRTVDASAYYCRKG